MRRYVKLLLVISLLLSLTNSVSSQTLRDSIVSNFGRFMPSEKLYLHIDKPDYIVGDTLWFAGYLRNSMTLEDVYSNFIYIDLIDSQDSVVLHKKIKRVDGVFKGHLRLDNKVTDGEYCIRAYSNWMQNFPKEHFFYKNIKVHSLSQSNVRFWADVTKIDSSKFSLNLGVLGGPSLIKRWGNQKLDLTIRNLTTGRRSRVKDQPTTSRGHLNLTTDDVRAGDVVVIKIKGKNEDDKFTSYVRINIPEKDFDIQFLPEGGEFVAGGMRRIAYKALSSDGKPIDVSGYIINKKGAVKSTFKSKRDGMGVVELNALEGESYSAFIMTSDSLSKRVELPEVKSNGVSIIFDYDKDGAIYAINKVGSFASEKLYVIAHSRGELKYVIPVEEPSIVHSIPYSILTPGISHILVVNSKCEPIAERLFFIDPSKYKQEGKLSIKSDKQSYSKREKVSLTLDCPENFNGIFSISVTDNEYVKLDSLADNIISNLLLTSDLNGDIEDPYSYLGSPDVDLLMLTNGWRKFKIGDILNSTEQSLDSYMEVGQTIIGQVESEDKNIGKKSSMFCQVVGTNSVKLTPLRADLSFEIEGLDIEGEKPILLKIVNPNDKHIDGTISIVDDFRESLPWVKSPLATAGSRGDDSIYQHIVNDDPFLQTFLIDEISVGAKALGGTEIELDEPEPMRLSEEQHRIYMSVMNSYIPFISKNLNLEQIIQRQGRRWTSVTEYVIDGLHYTVGDVLSPGLPHVFGSEIKAIELNENYMNVMPPSLGIIIVEIDGISSVKNGYLEFSYEGYDNCDKEFYSPKYTTDKIEEVDGYALIDLRTTVYWNPEIKIVDGKLSAPIEFYTADNLDSKLNIIIEGLDTKTNTPINLLETIEIKDKE